MPAERVSMRQAREIIRLKFSAGLPTREIARRLGLAPSTVRETLSRLESAGLSWPLPEGIGDAELEAALYANRRSKRGHRRHAEPDWPAVHRELKRKRVTLLIVWDEYVAAGSTPMCARSRQSAASRNCSCRTIRRPLSSRPAFMILRSIGPMPKWQRITEPPFCRRDRGGRGTKPRLSRPCSSSSDGCSGGYVIEPFTAYSKLALVLSDVVMP